jgi:hypothetical protein
VDIGGQWLTLGKRKEAAVLGWLQELGRIG